MMSEKAALIALCLGFFTGLPLAQLIALSTTFRSVKQPTRRDICKRHPDLGEKTVEKVMDAFAKMQSFITNFEEKRKKSLENSGFGLIAIKAFRLECSFCAHATLVHAGNAGEIEARLLTSGCLHCGITPNSLLHDGVKP